MPAIFVVLEQTWGVSPNRQPGNLAPLGVKMVWFPFGFQRFQFSAGCFAKTRHAQDPTSWWSSRL